MAEKALKFVAGIAFITWLVKKAGLGPDVERALSDVMSDLIRRRKEKQLVVVKSMDILLPDLCATVVSYLDGFEMSDARDPDIF